MQEFFWDSPCIMEALLKCFSGRKYSHYLSTFWGEGKKNLYAWRARVVMATMYVLRRGCEQTEGTSTISSVQLYLAVIPNKHPHSPTPAVTWRMPTSCPYLFSSTQRCIMLWGNSNSYTSSKVLREAASLLKLLPERLGDLIERDNNLQTFFFRELRVHSLHLSHQNKVVTSSLPSKLEHKKLMNYIEFIFSLDSPPFYLKHEAQRQQTKSKPHENVLH